MDSGKAWPLLYPERGDLDDQVRTLSTPMLKRMWDSEEWSAFCDEIHAAMNERGEGRYVAV